MFLHASNIKAKRENANKFRPQNGREKKMLDGGERTKATHTQGKEEGKKSNEKGRKYVLQKNL